MSVVLCVGEPLIVLGPAPGESLEHTDSLHLSIGGAEANVAVHLARLGVPVRFAGRVGNDPFGRRIRSTLAIEGVDVTSLLTDPQRPTGMYVKEPTGAGTVPHYYRRGSAASAMVAVPAAAFDGVGQVHITGVLAGLGRSCAAAVAALLAGPLPVSFDVNHRPALWEPGAAEVTLRAIAARATIVFVGLDEAARLWDCATADDVRVLLPGVELVVKDEDRAAVAFRGEQRVEVPALAVDVIEPVGAGDAFAAGYLAARRRGGDLAEALRTGHAVAATALSTHGDQGAPPDPALLSAAATGAGWADA